MNDDTSFETHRQQETRDFILQLRCLIVEKDAEIERLKTDRDKWEYECKIAYKAFNESNVKKVYEDMHQTDIEEHNRMLHEIAILKALLTRAADALEKWCVPMRHPESKLIDELRKAA